MCLLKDDAEGSRNSACMALGKIGQAANAALPALRVALSDESQDVRRFAAVVNDYPRKNAKV
jgi:HEAT repeat protein